MNTPNKPHTRISISHAIIVLFIAIALVVAYLFALNGRYIQVDDDYYFDKWTKTIIVINKYEMIE